MVERYRKKPLIVEAIHCTFDNKNEWWDDLAKMCEHVGIEPSFVSSEYAGSGAWMSTKITFSNGYDYNGRALNALAPIRDGDYLVKGVDGSIYPVIKETFEKVYDKVDDNNETGVISW